MARLLDVYEDAKNERGVIDFEDILIYLCGMLQERADVASIVRKQYRSFVVDEFQDVNLLQARSSTCGWVGATTCASSATSRRPSTPSRAPPRTT